MSPGFDLRPFPALNAKQVETTRWIANAIAIGMGGGVTIILGVGFVLYWVRGGWGAGDFLLGPIIVNLVLIGFLRWWMFHEIDAVATRFDVDQAGLKFTTATGQVRPYLWNAHRFRLDFVDKRAIVDALRAKGHPRTFVKSFWRIEAILPEHAFDLALETAKARGLRVDSVTVNRLGPVGKGTVVSQVRPASSR